MEKIMCSAIYVMDKTKQISHKPINIELGFIVCGLRHCNCFETLSMIYKNKEYMECV